MTVYHGSSVEIIDIDLSKCEPYRDFGKGFYVTNFIWKALFLKKHSSKNSNFSGARIKFASVHNASCKRWNSSAKKSLQTSSTTTLSNPLCRIITCPKNKPSTPISNPKPTERLSTNHPDYTKNRGQRSINCF
jgi:hypothetical protein